LEQGRRIVQSAAGGRAVVGDEAAAAEAPLVMDAGVGRIFTSKEAIRRSRPHRITAVEVEREGERESSLR